MVKIAHPMYGAGDAVAVVVVPKYADMRSPTTKELFAVTVIVPRVPDAMK